MKKMQQQDVMLCLIKDSLKTYGFTEAEITELNAFIESVITDVK